MFLLYAFAKVTCQIGQNNILIKSEKAYTIPKSLLSGNSIQLKKCNEKKIKSHLFLILEYTAHITSNTEKNFLHEYAVFLIEKTPVLSFFTEVSKKQVRWSIKDMIKIIDEDDEYVFDPKTKKFEILQ